MGEGDYADFAEDLRPPAWFKELSLKQIQIGDDNEMDQFATADDGRVLEGSSEVFFKSEEELFDPMSGKEGEEEERVIDPFDHDLDSVMQ
jgi:hypothetical protein